MVTVVSPNAPPVLAPINGQVALVGTPFSLTALASDVYQHALTYSLSGLPSDATLTPALTYGTAVLNWTPAATNVGTYTVTIGVTDATNSTSPLRRPSSSRADNGQCSGRQRDYRSDGRRGGYAQPATPGD